MAAAEAEQGCCSEALKRDAAEESCGSDVVEMRPAAGKDRPIVETVLLEPGETFVGTDRPKILEDGEGPARRVRITKKLEVDVHECTNEQYAKFVAATAYETDSEKFGWSFVFHLELDAAARAGVKSAVKGVEWWLPVNGSWWREPTGPGSEREPLHEACECAPQRRAAPAVPFFVEAHARATCPALTCCASAAAVCSRCCCPR